jgi:superfamily II DNA/RNA helicase
MLANPVEINIAVSKPPEQIKQAAFVVFEQQKIPLIKHVLQNGNFSSILIFCSSKLSVKQLTAELRRSKLPAGEIHSDLEQEAREQALIDFKNKKLSILVATDILSRGIHIDDIDLVINFNVPGDGEDYVHRIGRTARAESKGTAYTFINEKEQGRFKKIEQLIGRDIEKLPVPESFGPTPALSSGDFRSKNKKNFKNFKRK